MTQTNNPSFGRIGYACCYTPLPLIDAAGFEPWRILPLGDPPDRAGQLLHDNLCPHVKRILDLATADELPALRGVVFMASCDAMRRLADVWPRVHADVPCVLVDLPPTTDESAAVYFAAELHRLAETLLQWGGYALNPEMNEECALRRAELGRRIADLRARRVCESFIGGAAWQALCNRLVTHPIGEALALADRAGASFEKPDAGRVPVYVFGNVLPDPEALALIESCGARVVGEDLCTGSRQFDECALAGEGDVFLRLARAILGRTPCARTLHPDMPGEMSRRALAEFTASGARGAIGHSVKCCDPYVARFPDLRKLFRDEGAPLLILEGDCTMRSVGQQKTRIEAFIEMLR